MTQTTFSEHVVARPPGADHQYVSVDGHTYCIETLARLHRAGMLRSDHPAFDVIDALVETSSHPERLSRMYEMGCDGDETRLRLMHDLGMI